MLAIYFSHLWSDPILLWCSVVMLVLFGIDLYGAIGQYSGRSNQRHIDFKTTIVSIGLFATFFGVLLGLYGFDSRDISRSVPKLLEGLRFAFAASVLGMFLSLVLSIIHKALGKDNDEEGMLQSIDKKLGDLLTSIQSPDALIGQVTEMKSFLQENFRQINQALDKALLHLAKGATEEVVQALEKVITEFNSNLQTQFGDNFKQLNVACHQLVEWQGKYKDHIDVAEKSLTQIIASLEQSSAAVKELAQYNHETKEVCKEVGQLIRTYDIEVKTLATYLESCKTLGARASDFLVSTEHALTMSTQNLNAFSKTVESSVGKQAESLARLTKELDEQVPKTLGELEKTLTKITNHFAADYRSLFQFITDKR